MANEEVKEQSEVSESVAPPEKAAAETPGCPGGGKRSGGKAPAQSGQEP